MPDGAPPAGAPPVGVPDDHDAEGLYADSPSSVSLWSGGRIDLLAPVPEAIHLDDIAHALARTCRYGGHVTHFLSVARHSIWVSEGLVNMGHAQHALWGLLHDASEAYLGDMVKPLKHSPRMSAFVEVEYALDQALAARFDLPFPMPQVVRDADRAVTVQLEMGQWRRWRNDTSYARDEADFLKRYMELGGPKLDYSAKVYHLADHQKRRDANAR